MDQLLLGILLVIFLCPTKTIQQKQCILKPFPRTRTFNSLSEYQGTKISFDPDHPGYLGNFVEFSFKSIDRLPKNAFVSFGSDSIWQMKLNNKNLSTIDEGAFFRLFCLHNLELKNNNITSLSPDVFKGLTNLNFLDLSGNFIEVLPAMAFSLLRNLEKLYIANNKIKSINSFAFYNVTRLEVLNLDENSLRTVPESLFEPLISLRKLYLNRNKFGEIETRNWEALDNLDTLELAHNHLSIFDTGYNFSFPKLEYLNLSSNHLTHLNVHNLKLHFPKLESIDINFNRWNCEELESIVHFLKASSVSFPGASDNSSYSVSGIDCVGVNTTYVKSTTGAPYTTSSTPMTTSVRTTETAKYSEDILEQNKEIRAENGKILDDVKYLHNVITYMIVILVLYVSIDLLVRTGVCLTLYGRMFGSGRYNQYIDGGDIENVMLIRR